MTYSSPKFWSAPIADYLKIGEEKFPNGFDRTIGTLDVYDDKLWFGYGDTRVNMGSYTPIEFRYFDDPQVNIPKAAKVAAENQGAKQRTPTDTGEERILPFNRINDQLWQAGYDSNSDDELWTQALPGPERLIQGNIFVLNIENETPIWEKRRNIPGGEHVHDLAYVDGVIYAVGSGAANRQEWDDDGIFRYLWQSKDLGESFKVFHRVRYSMGDGDTRYRALLAINKKLYVFGYINPSDPQKRMEGRHLQVKGEKLEELKGEIGSVVIWKTWPINLNNGLAIGKVGSGISKPFLINDDGPVELIKWPRIRVIYITPGEKKGYWLVLSGSGEEIETFSIYRFHENTIEKLDKVMDLGNERLSSITLWNENLYYGTENGQILKSERVK